MKRSMENKTHMLSHGALGLKAAELEAVKDRFHKVKDCTVHARM